MKVATQPVEAPNARYVVHSQPTGANCEDFIPVEQSFTSKKTVPVTAAAVSVHSDMDSEDDKCSEPDSPAGVTEEQGMLSDRDMARGEKLDRELSVEAYYRCKRKSSPPENPPPGGENFLGNHPPPPGNPPPPRLLKKILY